MIRAFRSTDKIYETNGDVVITPTKARVFNSDNGDYYLELTCGIEYNDYMQANNIIVAPTPTGDQAFRIRTVEKNKNRITVKAWHVFYDSQTYLIADSYAMNKTCQQALEHFNAALDNTSPFTVSSDILTINTYRCVRTSFAECIQNVLERWGGHLYRDNWHISIKSEIGQDNGITIEYRKNLKELTASYDWGEVVTKIMPVGRDGILLDEIYLYSNIQYDIPYTRAISFEQDINEEDYQDESGETDVAAYEAALKEDLREQAINYLQTYSLPIINYELQGNPEKVTDIGDTIEVKDERIGVNVLTEVIAYEYDAIAEKYVSLEFGNFTNTLSDLLANISSSTSDAVGNAIVTLSAELAEALQEAQEKIWHALSSSYCIYEGDKILIVDRLPANRAINVMRINSQGIGFSHTGINGTFTNVWSLNGTFNAQAANIINLTADLIKGGTLKLGNLLNQSGKIDIYDAANTLIGKIDQNGITMYGENGGYIAINPSVGLAAYDVAGNPIYWAENDTFYTRKSAVMQELNVCDKIRLLPMQLISSGQKINDGIGIIGYYEGV